MWHLVWVLEHPCGWLWLDEAPASFTRTLAKALQYPDRASAERANAAFPTGTLAVTPRIRVLHPVSPFRPERVNPRIPQAQYRARFKEVVELLKEGDVTLTDAEDRTVAVIGFPSPTEEDG